MVSTLESSTLAALPIDEDVEHAKQSFTTCDNDYCLIYKGTKNFAWYPQGPNNATHSRGPTNHCLYNLEPLLPHHANYYL
jgi:hypothetical protein